MTKNILKINIYMKTQTKTKNRTQTKTVKLLLGLRK